MKKLIASILIGLTLSVTSVATSQAAATNHTQAVRAAKEYLQVEAFSLKGLEKQLKFDGYSNGDAVYGATHSGGNWMKEAVKAGKEYLATMPFSFSGLVAQLKYDGFTTAQAIHGAHGAGL